MDRYREDEAEADELGRKESRRLFDALSEGSLSSVRKQLQRRSKGFLNARLFDVCFTAVGGQSTGLRFQKSSTCLHVAAWAGSVDVVKYLLSIGASPEVADALNQRPLEVASSTRVKQLLRPVEVVVGINDHVDMLRDGVRVGLDQLRSDVSVSIGRIGAELGEVRPMLEQHARAAAKSEIYELRGVVARKLATELKSIRAEVAKLARRGVSHSSRRQEPLKAAPPPPVVAAPRLGPTEPAAAALEKRVAHLEKELNYELDAMEALQNTPHLMPTSEGRMALVVPQSIHHGDGALRDMVEDLTEELDGSALVLKGDGSGKADLVRLAALFKDEDLVPELQDVMAKDGHLEIRMGESEGRMASECALLRHDSQHCNDRIDLVDGQLHAELDAARALRMGRVVDQPGGAPDVLYVSLASCDAAAAKLLRREKGDDDTILVTKGEPRRVKIVKCLGGLCSKVRRRRNRGV